MDANESEIKGGRRMTGRWSLRHLAIRKALIQAQIENASYAPDKQLRDSCEKKVDKFFTGNVVWRWSPRREQIEEAEC